MEAEEGEPSSTRLRRARVTLPGSADEEAEIASLERAENGQLVIRCGKSLGPLVKEFSDTEKAVSAEKPAPLDTSGNPTTGDASSEKAEKLWARLSDFLTGRGCSVEPLPNADHQITVQFDLATGRALGQATDLVPGLDAGDIAARVFESVRSAFERPIGDMREAVARALHDDGDDAAARLFLQHENFGLLALAHDVGALVDLLAQVDLDRVSDAHQVDFAWARLTLADRARARFLAGRDAEFLLKADSALTPEKRASLRLTLGNAAMARGQRETALVTWREVASDPSNDVGNRAWAYKNTSLALPAADESCQLHAELAAGEFLVLGDAREAAICAVRAAESQATREPEAALRSLAKAIVGLNTDDTSTRHARAHALLQQAELEGKLGSWEAGHDHAVEALGLLREILGATGTLYNGLVLSQHLAEKAGRDSAPFKEEAAALAPQVFGADEYELRGRLVALEGTFDQQEAGQIEEALRQSKSPELTAMLSLIRARHDPALSDSERVEMLEAGCVREREAPEFQPLVALPSLAGKLLEMGQRERALSLYQEILTRDPFDHVARQNTAALLLKLGRFNEAVAFFERQREVWGELPGIQIGLGQALLGKGDVNGAATAFAIVAATDGLPDNTVQAARAGLKEATSKSGVVQAPSRRLPLPVTKREWDDALSEFAEHVKAEARQRLWTTENKKKKWVIQPEAAAGGLLSTFLRGKFGDRMESFTELAAGAGRIDYYLVFEGGLRVIVELKMLGEGYSSTYAFSGEDQVTHYMDNRSCHLGYLVLFDARVRDYGKSIAGRPAAPNQVEFKFIDVRWSVK